MNNVSCRLWGKCWGDPAAPARLVVKWAGQQVFDGAVPTNGETPDARQTEYHEVLCTWTVNNLTAGLVPVEITVHNGSVSVNNIFLNNIVAGRYVHFKPNVANLDEIYNLARPKADINVRTYTDQEFLAMYGFPQDAPPNYVEYVDVSAEDTWVDGNFNRRPKNGKYTDGKLNVKLNGSDWYGPLPEPSVEQLVEELIEVGLPPNLVDEIASSESNIIHTGERNYYFKNGDTLSFDYLIEWDIT